MNARKYLATSLVIFICIIVSAGCAWDNKLHTPVVNGVADLSDNSVSHSIIELNGEWEFYPERFILPEEFNDKLNAKKVYLKVPGDWNSIQDVKGFGTYRIKLILPESYTHYSLKLKWVKSIAKVWIDENILVEQGAITSPVTESVPGDYITITDFIPEKYYVYLTVHVANYQDRRGGLCFPVSIATPNIMYSNEMKITFITAFIIGALAIVTLFHFALQFYFREFSLNLYISLICCSVISRLFVLTDSIYIFSLVSRAGYNLLVKTEFCGFILIFILLMQFFVKIYKPGEGSSINRFLYWFGIGEILYIVIMPVYYVKCALPLFQPYVLIVTLFTILSPLREGVKNGVSGAKIYFTIVLLGLLVFANDIIYFLISKGLPNISGYMFFIFLVGNFVVLSNYFSKVFQKNLYLKEEIHLKKKIVNNLSLLSTTDSLTGLYNRRFFDNYIDSKIKNYKKNDNLWLVMFDIDFFKNVNDELGHSSGDTVLKELSALVKGLIRTGDVLCRWGGEEFIIVVSGMDSISIRHFTERIRESVESYNFSVNRQITASFGVAVFIEGESAGDFIYRTDTALYKAKNSGRNRVVFAEIV